MTQIQEKEHLIGVDVGGTKVAAGLVNARAKSLARRELPWQPTMQWRGWPPLFRRSMQYGPLPIRRRTRQPDFRDRNLRSRTLDPRTGIVINPPNLPGWRNFPLAAEISEDLRVPVRVDNDGNAAALAEALWGAGRGFRNVFCATIGTGIGTGIVFDGHIYHGRTGAAAEGGHKTIDYRGPRCGCGKLGCIEVLASGPAIARRASEKIAKRREVFGDTGTGGGR